MRVSEIHIKLISYIRAFILILGISFIILIALSFTSAPYWGIYHLAVSESNYNKPEADVIIIMGGAGMPSKSALIRTFYAAEISKKYNKAKIIIALPDNLNDSLSHIIRMREELRIREVNAEILFEPKGNNTRSQVLNIAKILNQDFTKNILIVSSPEHMYRTIKAFKKIGFQNIGGIPAFEIDISSSLLLFESDKIGGKIIVPDIGDSNQLRYQFWNHLKYEITLAREYTAIIYYKAQSWI